MSGSSDASGGTVPQGRGAAARARSRLARALGAEPSDRRRRLARALLVAFVLGLLFDAVPAAPPDYFFDSRAYILWPEMAGDDGEVVPSKRPPSYPLTIDALGHGRTLAWVQAWALVGGFVALGWGVARGAGVVVLGLLARAFPIACWPGAVLTEALTLAALAALLALALQVGERLRASAGAARRVDRTAVLALAAAAVLAAYFTFLRDANFLLLPLVGVAFVRGPWRVAALAGAFVLALAATSFTIAERESRWQPAIATAISVRMRADRPAFAELKRQGMPTFAFIGVTPEMGRWMDDVGRSAYQRWVLSRPESYVEFTDRLVGPGEPADFRTRYFPDRPADDALARIGGLVWRALAPPFWLWAWLVLVPAVEWARRREVTPVGALAGAGALFAYGFAFAAYHAAAVESARHMLAALVLARVATFSGVVAVVRAWRRA